MKPYVKIVVTFVLVLGIPFSSLRAQDPVTEAIKQGITKVIKAIDLRIQRLQNRTIALQNAQKAVENTLSKVKLEEISDWVEKQRTLYKEYYDELWKVKNLISYYHRVKEITTKQVTLVNQYKRAFQLFKLDKNFSSGEIEYMSRVYSGIFDESLKILDAVQLVVNSFSTQMSDEKRLAIISKAADQLDETYNDLQAFNNQNMMLSLNRSKDKQDIESVKALYGLK